MEKKEFIIPNKSPFTSLGKKIESATRKALYDFDLLSDEKAIMLGLSGGKDSLTLLFMLKAILGRGFPDLKLYAMHVQEKFLTNEVDLKYLQNICDELQVPLIIKSFSIEDDLWGEKERFNCYLCSRIRRKLIFNQAKEMGIKLVTFAHHMDDNAQTFLMNLIHKAECSSMLPKLDMVKYGIRIVRPFMYVPEQDIIGFAKLYNYYEISCSCPYGKNTLRKKAKDIISLIEKDFPNVCRNLANSALKFGSKKAIKNSSESLNN
jgi:tRNA 2-thiocytidine biosynthesis protein TtcA